MDMDYATFERILMTQGLAVVLVILVIAAGAYWFPKIGRWAAALFERQVRVNESLAESNESMAETLKELREFNRQAAQVDASKVKSNLVLAKMHLLHTHPEKREEAMGLFREIERLCDEAKR